MCGVLAHFGVTLQRGRFISAGGQLALDVFELSDDEGVLGTRGQRPDGAAPPDDGAARGELTPIFCSANAHSSASSAIRLSVGR